MTSYTIPSVAGVEAELAANAAADRNRANHTGSQSADTLTDGTTVKAYTGAERVKLAGIADGATVNRPDTAVDTLLAAKADLVGGVIPTGQIPALALTNAVPVASQAAMLALTAAQVQPGDIAVRADGAGTFILTAADPTQLASWTRLNAPTDAVTTVNGQTGTVVLAAADVGADPAGAAAAVTLAGLGGLTQAQIDARVDARADAKGAAAAVTLASLGGAPTVSPAFTGTPTRAVGATQKPLRAGPYQPYLGPVSNRAHLPVGNSVSIATYAEYMTWRLYRAADDIPAAALIYASFYGVNENGATGITGAVQASIEYPVGTITRITFAGGNVGTIPTNGIVQSDLTALPVTIPAGARFWVGTYVQWSGTGNVPRFQDGLYIQSGTSNAQATYARESALGSATVGGLTNTVMTGARGTNGGISGKTGDSYGPSAILGMTQRPTIFIAGDSESQEQFPPAITAQDAEGLAGVIEQIIGNRVGYINGSTQSDAYANANATYTNRLALSQFCTHIIDQYGVNSVYGQAIATNIADFTAFRGKFPTTKPYLKTTVIPKVTGAWIKPDLSDQTPVTTLANFIAFNAFVRQGANGLIDGHIDLEDVTGYRDTGKVKPAQRYLTDVSTTAGSNVITSASANFLASDIGKVVCVIGAGAAAANLIGVISTVTSATTATIVAIDSSALNAGTAVTGAAAGIGLSTYDGIHPTRLRQADIRDSVQALRAVAPILALG